MAASIAITNYQRSEGMMAGWWFGTCFYFSIQLGMSFFSGVGLNHQPGWFTIKPHEVYRMAPPQ